MYTLEVMVGAPGNTAWTEAGTFDSQDEAWSRGLALVDAYYRGSGRDTQRFRVLSNGQDVLAWAWTFDRVRK